MLVRVLSIVELMLFGSVDTLRPMGHIPQITTVNVEGSKKKKNTQIHQGQGITFVTKEHIQQLEVTV